MVNKIGGIILGYEKEVGRVKDYTVIDFETTGFGAKKSKIIQIGAVKFRDHTQVEEYTAYVYPGVEIPARITELTGISNEDVLGSITIGEAIEGLLDVIGEDVIVAHNASFDMGFLLHNLQESGYGYGGNKVIDTLELARGYIQTVNHKLPTLKEYLGLGALASHDALADCIVAGAVYKYCNEQEESIEESKRLLEEGKSWLDL